MFAKARKSQAKPGQGRQRQGKARLLSLLLFLLLSLLLFLLLLVLLLFNIDALPQSSPRFKMDFKQLWSETTPQEKKQKTQQPTVDLHT